MGDVVVVVVWCGCRLVVLSFGGVLGRDKGENGRTVFWGLGNLVEKCLEAVVTLTFGVTGGLGHGLVRS